MNLVKRERLIQSKAIKPGQGIMEFAIVLPVFLFLVYGIFAFAHFFFAYFINATTSRESARYAATSGLSVDGNPRYQECDYIRDAGLNIGSMIGLNLGDITITYDGGPGTSSKGSCPIGFLGPTLDNGDRVIVTTTTIYDSLLPFGMLQNVPFSSTSRRSIIF